MRNYDTKKLAELWNAGKMAREIAEVLGVPVTTVVAYIKAHRDECPKKEGVKGENYDKKLLAELWNAGKMAKEIAEVLGVSVTTVEGYVATHRDECPKKEGVRGANYDKKLLAILWKEGYTIKEIAKVLGVPVTKVVGYINAHRDECPKKGAGRRANYGKEMLVKLWKEGYTKKEIAKVLGVPVTKVVGYINTHRDECPKKGAGRRANYDTKKLAELWKEGYTKKEIAEVLGVPVTTVTGYVTAHRDECPKKDVRCVNYDTKKLAELWKEGYTKKEIAKVLGVSVTTVVGYIDTHRDGCPKKEAGRRANYDKKLLAKLWKEGYTKKKIAEVLGVSVTTVTGYVTAHRDKCPKRR